MALPGSHGERDTVRLYQLRGRPPAPDQRGRRPSNYLPRDHADRVTLGRQGRTRRPEFQDTVTVTVAETVAKTVAVAVAGTVPETVTVTVAVTVAAAESVAGHAVDPLHRDVPGTPLCWNVLPAPRRAAHNGATEQSTGT